MLTTPPAAYSSGATCRRLDELYHKLGVLIAADEIPLAARQVVLIDQAVSYLRANFPPAALQQGPVL